MIICGAPGCGKGTQCELLKEKYGVHHISTGDVLRANVKEGTDLGKKAKGVNAACCVDLHMGFWKFHTTLRQVLIYPCT